MTRLYILLNLCLFFLTIPVIVFAQDSGQSSKFRELQERLKTRNENESVEDVLEKYILNEEKPILQTEVSEHKSLEVTSSALAIDGMTRCTYSLFKITFLCDSKWGSHEEEDIVIYNISATPAVSFSITKVSEKVKYLETINKDDLALTGQYAEGFVLQDAVLNNKKVKKVTAFSKASPQMRYLDYYILNDGILYSLLFSVDPKEAWDGYKFLIKAVAESVDFNN